MYLNTRSTPQTTKQKLVEQLMNKEMGIMCNEDAMVYFKEFWRPFPEKKGYK